MPRQGVPYPSREICSLKCQIDALNAKINELMKSINGVQGDGQGDLSLISGDPAIVINNDAAQHEIEIALDSSQLPAAAVSSVNGQTGIVDLDGADIPLNPGQSTPTVQNAVAANAGAISQLQADLNQEVLDRGNADSALSTAINAALATIPGEVSSQIMNDVTINQLVAADAQNVKLTGAQAISGVKTVPTEATGSATQQIANGAKVKNELDAYAPMVRTTGNQDIAGNKRIIGRLIDRVCYVKNTTGSTNAIPVFRLSNSTKNDRYMKTILFMGGRTVPTSICEIIWNDTTLTKNDIAGTQNNAPSIWEDTNGDYWLCFTIGANNSITAFELQCLRNAGFDEPMYPIFSSNAPSISGWSQVVSA